MSTYAEYLAKAKKQKINKALLAPKAAKAPCTIQRSRYEYPLLDAQNFKVLKEDFNVIA